MIAVVQRVSRAEVRTAEPPRREAIGTGLVILLGVGTDDGDEDAGNLARKIAGLRIFEDAQGKMNLSVMDAAAPPAALVVSQFTLLGDASRGRRPSFTGAAHPEKAAALYETFCKCLADEGVSVKTGVFGAHMDVELVNDGPVTLILKSRD
ncbi:MAG TPA: D-tyrosyl-tRNA(Tyr) deacylase [Planctomycetes bacterium]|nr:D-tyrosyl-tRNA(Tyr) deacylase [Planctomycetota bacterium]